MPDHLTDVERILRQIKGYLPRLLFVLVGPSGVGKNTIIKKLLTNNPYLDRIRTYTTRPARQGEIPSEQYHFVTFEQFRGLALAGKLMEADESNIGHDVYQLGALYSMPGDLFEEIPPDKHLVIAEVDIYGMRRLRQQIPDCVTIFISAPPVDLQQRIRERADEHMNEDSLVQRMETAREQIRSAGEFDYLVFNEAEHLDATVRVIETIVAAERSRVRQGIDLEKIIASEAFGQTIQHDSPP
jgi:guanylate kinase